MNNVYLLICFSYVLDLNYDFHYRDQIPFTAKDKRNNTIADVSMGVVLAFVLYKCYSEPEHLLVCISNVTWCYLIILYFYTWFVYRETFRILIPQNGLMKNWEYRQLNNSSLLFIQLNVVYIYQKNNL